MEDTLPSVFCAHLEMVDTASLVENPRNPNRHPENLIVLGTVSLRGEKGDVLANLNSNSNAQAAPLPLTMAHLGCYNVAGN